MSHADRPPASPKQEGTHMRNAIVISADSDLATVERYLPANYTAREVTVVAIEGIDNAGWTLDDYVIPRLASGLHFAIEVEARLPRRVI
jgi:hypothetical protein